MSDIFKVQGPVEVEIKVHFTNGETSGVATIGMGVGAYPSAQVLRDRVAKFEAEELPEGFHLMTKREYWDFVCMEKFGQLYALPGSDEYDN